MAEKKKRELNEKDLEEVTGGVGADTSKARGGKPAGVRDVEDDWVVPPPQLVLKPKELEKVTGGAGVDTSKTGEARGARIRVKGDCGGGIDPLDGLEPKDVEPRRP